MPLFSAERLHRFTKAVLQAAGLNAEEAQACADAAQFADLRGTDTHGSVYIVRKTLQSLREHKTLPGASPLIERESEAIALVNGNGLAGPALGEKAMTMAMDKARKLGIGAVVTYRGNPLGMLGYYPYLAAAQGLFGLAMANTAPSVAPFGATTPVFGTNPLAYAVPAMENRPILFDMASSVAAAGKLSRAQRQGVPIPEGWAIDASGEPITDPSKVDAGALLPFGGHKGSGIALLVHVLTGMLAGVGVGGEQTHDHPDPRRRGQSSLFLALDPAFFGTREDFQRLVDRQIGFVHAARPAPGTSAVLFPGERGWREQEDRRERGIQIADGDWQVMRTALRKSGLPEDELIAQYGPVPV